MAVFRGENINASAACQFAKDRKSLAPRGGANENDAMKRTGESETKTGAGRESLTILGIDPGLARVGLAVIVHDGQSGNVALADQITTPKSWDLARRLKRIHEAIRDAAHRFQPDAAAIETLYFAANVKTAIQVAQARGVAILATADEGIELFEYTPLQIKQAVAGYGRARKDQMIHMVQLLLAMKDPPRSDHTADALAVAICHAHHYRLNRLVAQASAHRERPK